MSEALQAIQDARKAGDFPTAQRLILAEAQRNGGKVSSLLGDQLALLHMASGHYAEARDLFLLIAAKFPDQPALWRNIGECSEVLGEYEVARHAFRQCIEAHHGRPDVKDAARGYFGMGSVLYRLGDPVGGESWWRDGLERACDSADAIFQRAAVRLTLGEYEQGWQDFEARRTMQGFRSSVRGHGQDPTRLPPDWDGVSDGRVLVYADQGAGDALLFSRWLRFMPCDYVLAVGAPLRRILDGFAVPPRCTHSAPLSSLPRLLAQPGPIPPHHGAAWKAPRNSKPRIGVCWKGATSYKNDRDRSCPADFRPALADPRWELVSLQQGEGAQFRDYQENAEFLNTLDAVVSVDTSTVHLAGMLNVPTVLIAQAQPFWCWGVRGETSSWYPSVRIVRRRHVWAWPDALAQAKDTLSRILP